MDIETEIVSHEIPLRPDPEVRLAAQKEEFKKPFRHRKEQHTLITGKKVTDEEVAKAAIAVGLGPEWVQRSRHLCILAKWACEFPTVNNMIGHAIQDIGALDRTIALCEMAIVDKDVPALEKTRYVQSLVAAVKTKTNLNLMIERAKALQEGIREDLVADERRPAMAPPSMGPIQINVNQGGTVEVKEKAS